MRLVIFLIVTLVGILGGVVLYFSKKLKLFVIGFILLLISLISGFSIVNKWSSDYKVAKQSIYVKNLGDLSSTYKNVVSNIDEEHPFCDIYDIVDFTYGCELSGLQRIKSYFYLDSNLVSYSVTSNTGLLELSGSDILQVSDTNAVPTYRGGTYYVTSWYIRYNDILYKINNKLDLDENETYYIKYAIDSEGNVSDLHGSIKCYTQCEVFILNNK